MNEVEQRILFEQISCAVDDVKTALLESVPQPVSRRERIATAALQGLCGHYGTREPGVLARWALREADALIAELDKPAEGSASE